MVASPEWLMALATVADGRRASELESETLDFKDFTRAPEPEALRTLLTTTLCLANHRGGSVVVGVADKESGPEAIVGTDFDPQEIREYIHSNSRPRLLVDVRVAHHGDVRLVVVKVPESTQVHADTKGRAPRRVGTDCHSMDPAEQQALSEARVNYDWTSRRSTDPEDIDPNALAAVRLRLSRSTRAERRGLGNLRDSDLLAALGLVDGQGSLLVAGSLFAGRDAVSVDYIYRPTTSGEPEQVAKIRAPLVVVYEQISELIRLRRKVTPVNLPDGQQLQVEDFPEAAAREALSNALLHRDYRLEGPVVVDHSPSVLVITSPGRLVPGVSPENILTHPSKPRNRTLADAAAVVELAEEVGGGVDRMYREMVRAGGSLPQITEGMDHVRVALVGTAPNVNIARYVGTLSDETRNDTDAMLVLLRLCTVKTITAESIAGYLQRSVDEAESSLRHLASDQVGMLERTRQTVNRRHPTYRFTEETIKALGTAIPYARHTSSQIDAKIVNHLREYDHLSNQTVQNLLSVGMSRATAILADLSRRKIIKKLDGPKRGPGVQYGRGSAFPAAPQRRRRPRTT